MLKRGKVQVFPHQIACFPSEKCMFSLGKSNVWRGKRLCFPRFRPSKPSFQSFRFLEERLSAPFFFQNFCKNFAIALTMNG